MGASEMDGLKCELIILGISYQRSVGRAGGQNHHHLCGKKGGTAEACTEPITTSGPSVRLGEECHCTVRTQTQNPSLH